MKSKIKLLVIFCFLFLFAARSFAQEGYLRGSVVNSKNITINDASVVIKKTIRYTNGYHRSFCFKDWK